MNHQKDLESNKLNRRDFINIAASTALLLAVGNVSNSVQAASPLVLTSLPYVENALEPVISANTIGYHFGKHHKVYVENLNKLIANTEYADYSLEKIIVTTQGNPEKISIFNNAAQIWNHDFYWRSLKPNGGGMPSKVLKEKIEDAFVSVDACKKELVTAATSQFGSGWAWLILQEGKIKVIKTNNAARPNAKNIKPLLVIDVWEHAYYLDYQNRRVDYVNAILDKIINWDFASENLG